eukprot:5516952-Prorocentrum_lima.AAC.1
MDKYTERPEEQLALKKGGGVNLGLHQMRGLIQQQIREKAAWATIYIDFTQAYDTVARDELLEMAKKKVPTWLHQTSEE